MIEYQVWLKEPDGTTLRAITDWHSFDFQWFANGVGTLGIVLPIDYWNIFDHDGDGSPDRDMRFDVYRAVNGGDFNLLFDTCCFSRRYEYSRAAGTMSVTALTANSLLDRRIVSARPGTDEARKAGAAASILHDIVDEQMQSGGLFEITERDWSTKISAGFPVSGSPVVRAGFAYESIIEVCKKITDMSLEIGTYLAFDIVVDSSATGGLLFKTYINQRGTDRRSGIVLSERYGNIEPTAAVLDYSDERTMLYVGGGGEGRYRQIAAAGRDALTIASGRPYWGFNEKFYNATQQKGIQELANTGFAQLMVNDKKQTYAANILYVDGYQFGVDYGWGDRVTLYDAVAGRSADIRIDEVGVSASHEGETVDIKMEAVT